MPTLATRPKGLTRNWYHRARVLIAAYAVIGIFGLAYLLLRTYASNISQTSAILIAAIITAPWAVAFLWERLSTLKAFGVEVSFTSLKLDSGIVYKVPELETQLLPTSADDDEGSESELPSYSSLIASTIEEQRRVLVIDVHESPYWWPSRLFLLGALLSEFSAVEQLIFTIGKERNFVGMVSPMDLRNKLRDQTIAFGDLERSLVRAQDIDDDIRAEFQAIAKYEAAKIETLQHGTGDITEEVIRTILINFTLAHSDDGSRLLETAPSPERLIDRTGLENVLGSKLKDASLVVSPWDRPVDIAKRIVAGAGEVVPIVTEGRLMHVGSLSLVAQNVAAQILGDL